MLSRSRLGSACAVALFAVFGQPLELRADPFTLTVAAPNFLIPLAGQNGTLTVYSDGRTPGTSGFNALGTQTFTLAGNSTSTGYLTLNMVFMGAPLGDPDYSIEDASISFTVRDLDFLTDTVTSRVTLQEAAVIRSVNGTRLASPINLASYLPSGTTSTDDRTLTLRPIDLIPPLDGDDFTDPFTLSLRLSATARNTGSQSVTLLNTPESIVAGVRLDVDATPRQVPEPSTALLIGVGAVCAALRRRKRRLERS